MRVLVRETLFISAKNKKKQKSNEKEKEMAKEQKNIP